MVVSASSRHVPGLVLLRPGGPLDVAEALIHEAAHQRLFDMAITRDLLRADADGQPGFPPSWRRVVWPVEQTLAAFHAYACLAELSRAVPAAERIASLGPHSVLPEAPDEKVVGAADEGKAGVRGLGHDARICPRKAGAGKRWLCAGVFPLLSS